MTDWDIVTGEEPWRRGGDQPATARPAASPFVSTARFDKTFARLARLLSRAVLLDVVLDSLSYRLFSWRTASGEVRAWLSPPPPSESPATASRDHRLLLEVFGGIVERYNEPAGNLLLNHNEALTAAQASNDATFVEDYAWAFEECGGIPIAAGDYYPAAWESNGNCVLCERTTGRLLFFAPDHSDAELVPYPPCPMYTLHVRRGLPTLRDWVERIAAQWSEGLA